MCKVRRMEDPRETNIFLSAARSGEKIIIYEDLRFSNEAKKNKGLGRAIEGQKHQPVK
jgi:hypothetical protein